MNEKMPEFSDPSTDRANLREKLNKLVGEENFEEAAKIKTQIDELDQQMVKNPPLSKTFVDSDGKVIEERKNDKIGIKWLPSANDPEDKASSELHDQIVKERWEGKEVINNSPIVDYLLSENIAGRKFDENFPLHKLITKDVGKRLDLVIEMQRLLNDTKPIIELCHKKMKELWEPYCIKKGFFGKEYEEFRTFYPTYFFTAEKLKRIDEVPIALRQALNYFQTAYDNARFLRDKASEVINSQKA